MINFCPASYSTLKPINTTVNSDQILEPPVVAEFVSYIHVSGEHILDIKMTEINPKYMTRTIIRSTPIITHTQKQDLNRKFFFFRFWFRVFLFISSNFDFGFRYRLLVFILFPIYFLVLNNGFYYFRFQFRFWSLSGIDFFPISLSVSISVINAV